MQRIKRKETENPSIIPPPRASNGMFQDLNSLMHSPGALSVRLKAANGSPANVSAPH